MLDARGVEVRTDGHAPSGGVPETAMKSYSVRDTLATKPPQPRPHRRGASSPLHRRPTAHRCSSAPPRCTVRRCGALATL